MKLTRPTPRQQPETIIALIDVVFFLLVFFMLIGRMDATAPFDVTPPEARSGSDLPAGGLTLSLGSDGELALDGDEVLARDVVALVSGGLADNPDLTVRINAHRDSRLHRVLPLIAQLENVGAREVVLIVTPPDASQ